MGIHGLWKLLEPAGKDVTLESLENKVLAIDVSLWLHQAQQGNTQGTSASNPNSHLLTLFHRISKLLFYRIKPVFVFDGVAPELKKKTIIARNEKKQSAGDLAKEKRQELLFSLIKSGKIEKVLQKEVLRKTLQEHKEREAKKSNLKQGLEDDLYCLPSMPRGESPSIESIDRSDEFDSDSEEDIIISDDELYEIEENNQKKGSKIEIRGTKRKWRKWLDPSEVDVQDEGFKALPLEVRQDILTDLKEARKQSSWGQLHKMPKELDTFSSFQMNRLLHRRKVQEVWEDVQKEMSTVEVAGTSLGELETILREKGVDIAFGPEHVTQRIASDENRGFVFYNKSKDQKGKESDKNENASSAPLASIKEEPAESSTKTEVMDEDLIHIKNSGWSEQEMMESSEEIKEEQKSKFEAELIESKFSKENKKVKDFVRNILEEGADTGEDGALNCSADTLSSEVWEEDGLTQREILALLETGKTGEKISESSTTLNKENNERGKIFDELLAEHLSKLEAHSSGQTEPKSSSTKEEFVDKHPGTSHSNASKSECLETENVSDVIKLKHIEILGKDSEINSSAQEETLPNEMIPKVKDQTVVEVSETEIDKENEEECEKQVESVSLNKRLRSQPSAVTMDIQEVSSENLAVIEVSQVEISKENEPKVEDNSVRWMSNNNEEPDDMMEIQEINNEELTQEEILAIIGDQTKKVTQEEKDIVAVIESESDESDFVEVNETSYRAEEPEVTLKDLSPNSAKISEIKSFSEVKTKDTKNVEIIINLDSKSDDSNDIFEDVFQSNPSEENFDQKSRENSEEDNEKNNKENEEDTIESAKEKLQVAAKKKESRNDENQNVGEDLSEEDRHRLTLEMRKLEREASATLTEKIRLESQELLGLFGVPWVVAPFEAEAQCAFLESAPPKSSGLSLSVSVHKKFLAEGTITEDSDIWAFGASTVYRHVFDRRRTRVRLYSKEEILKKFGLSRIQVVQLALLTGSDYTIGLPGVGMVTALEVLAAFPGEKNPHASSSTASNVDEILSGLQHFADWWRRIEKNETDGTPIGHSYHDPRPAASKTLKRRLLTCLKSARSKQPGASLLPPGFPSRSVVEAYINPSIDDCRDTFSWLKPDEPALRSYAQLHFGWTKERTDSILKPLFARLKLSDKTDRTQTSLQLYFSRIKALPTDIDSSNIGVRAQRALEKISGIGEPSDDKDEEETQRKRQKNNAPKVKSAKVSRKPGTKEINKSEIPVGKKTGTQSVKKVDKPVPNVASVPIKKSTSVVETGFSSSLCSKDRIPQRERDNATSLESKLKAIEVLRRSKIDQGKKGGRFRNTKLKRAEVNLSESSDTD